MSSVSSCNRLYAMEINATLAGYEVAHFGGYYCGHAQQMTHYLALLVQA